MRKNKDINILFSLLERQPEGEYQEVMLDEKIKESKERWPIFELSDLSNEKKEDKKESESWINPKNNLESEGSGHGLNSLFSSRSLREKQESNDTNLKNIFNKLEKKEEKPSIIKNSIFDRLIR